MTRKNGHQSHITQWRWVIIQQCMLFCDDKFCLGVCKHFHWMVGFKIFTSQWHIPNSYNDTKKKATNPNDSVEVSYNETVHVTLWWISLFQCFESFYWIVGFKIFTSQRDVTNSYNDTKMAPKPHNAVEVSYNLTVHVILWWKILFSSL